MGGFGRHRVCPPHGAPPLCLSLFPLLVLAFVHSHCQSTHSVSFAISFCGVDGWEKGGAGAKGGEASGGGGSAASSKGVLFLEGKFFCTLHEPINPPFIHQS